MELISKMDEFFKNLQFKTIKFDYNFTVSLRSPSDDFLSSIMKNTVTRVNLCSTTESITVFSPGAQIIELRNNDPTKFNLKQIDLIMESHPRTIILCNVDPDVIEKKKLNVYLNGEEPETLQLKNYQSTVKNVIYIELPPPASSDKTSIELYVLLVDTVNGDECLSAWKERNLCKQDVEVVLVNNAGSKLKEKKPSKLTLMITKYETTKEFEQLWEEFKESFKSLTEPLQTLHFIFLVEGSQSQRDVIDKFTFGNNEFFKNLRCKTIEFDCKFTVPILYLSYCNFLRSSAVRNNGIRVSLGSTTTSVIVRSPNAQIIVLRNDNKTKFNLKRIKLITESYPIGIILWDVYSNAIKDKHLKVYWNNEKPKTLELKNFEHAAGNIIFMELTPPALPDTKLTPPASLDYSILNNDSGHIKKDEREEKEQSKGETSEGGEKVKKGEDKSEREKPEENKKRGGEVDVKREEEEKVKREEVEDKRRGEVKVERGGELEVKREGEVKKVKDKSGSEVEVKREEVKVEKRGEVEAKREVKKVKDKREKDKSGSEVEVKREEVEVKREEVKVKREEVEAEREVKKVKDKREREKGGGEGWQYHRSIVDSCLGEECDL
jgi:hypothetical protein